MSANLKLVEPAPFMVRDLARSLLTAEMLAVVSPKPPEVAPFRDSETGEMHDAYRIYWTDTYNQLRIDRPENKYLGSRGVTPPVAFLSSMDPENAEAAFKRSAVKAIVEGYKKAALFALTTGIPTVAINGVSGWHESDSEDGASRNMRSEILSRIKQGDELFVAFDGDAVTNDLVGGELVALVVESQLHHVKTTVPDFGHGKDGKRRGYDDWFATWNDANWHLDVDESANLEALYRLDPIKVENLEANAKWLLSNPDRFMQAATNFTDQGAATKFVQLFGEGNFYFLPDTGEWAFWDASAARWTRSKTKPTELAIQVSMHYARRAQVIRSSAAAIKGDDDVAKKSRETILKQAVPLEKWAAKLEGMATMTNFLMNVSNRAKHQRRSSDFDKDPHVLAVANGVVELRTGVLRAEEQDDLILRRCTAAYSETEPKTPGALRAREFVRSVTSRADGTPDAERERYLQTRLGSGLRGFNSTTSADILLGHGSNGKSAFANLMHHALGTYAADLDIKAFVATNKARDPEAAKPHLVKAIGARWVFAKEFEKTNHLNEAFFKEFTGGESMTIRANYAEGGSVELSANLLITTNYMPHLTHISRATMDRIALFPFRRSWNRDQSVGAFADADRWYIDEMKNDPEAQSWMLWWLVQGGVRWEQQNLRVGPMPADLVEARAEYEQSEDEMAEWMDLEGWEFSTDAGARAVQKDLYESYRRFKIGEKHVAIPESAKAFYSSLDNYANGKIKRHESSGQRYFLGIRAKGKF